MNIQPKYQKLWNLLADRLFRIPAYQRAYSWEKKQRQDLFRDITSLQGATPGTTHFMATMVGLARGKKQIVTDEFTEIEVVDGQQRLTTLIILLKAISNSLKVKAKEERALKEELNSLLIKNDEHSLLLLQTNHDTSSHFANYIRTGKHDPSTSAKILADRLLLEAIEECEEFVSTWSGTILDLGAILKNRLTFIFHEIEDERAVYTIFEVLNSRGLDVAWLDRLKSILMGMAFESKGNRKEAISELHRIWGDIYRCIGLQQGRSKEALRFAAALKSASQLSKVPSEEAAVDKLRELAGGSAKGAIETSNWVYAVVQAVDRRMADKRRSAVTKIAHARLLAVAIELREQSEKEREALLAAWEKVTFRIFGMCRKDARTRVGEYVRLAHRLTENTVKYKEALASIRGLAGDQFSIDAAVEELRDTNRYEGWEEELRYFMWRYEEHLASANGQNFSNAQWDRIWASSASKSIEHILAQSAGSNEKTKSKKTVFVHRLGNLLVLPPNINSKLSNKPPSDKEIEYEKTGLLIASEVKPFLKNWNRDAVIKREDDLIKWAKKEWKD